MIQPTTRFGQIRPQRVQSSHVFEQGELPSYIQEAAKIPSPQLNATFCNSTITPECLRALYKIGSAKADPKAPGFFAVNGFLEVGAPIPSLCFVSSEQSFSDRACNIGIREARRAW